jgi:outer membrane protein TolC
MSIEGSAPSVVQARGVANIFNRPQSYAVAQAREDARGAGFVAAGKREEIAYRTASLFLDAERAARGGELARKNVQSLERVLETVDAQVREGRALTLARKQAELELARARQSAAVFDDEQAAAETALALALGLASEERVRPAPGAERPVPPVPSSEESAIQSALQSNTELRRVESQVMSGQLQLRGQRAQRLPRADLVAQYAMMARFNNYDLFFQKFQRNNGQLGVSFQVPLFSGPGVDAQVAQTQADISRTRIDLNNTRNRIAADLRQAFRDIGKSESAAEVARLDLELAREQVSVNLALSGEGRLSLRELEQARVVENARWMAFFDARYAAEKARWNLLRLTGTLIPGIQVLP